MMGMRATAAGWALTLLSSLALAPAATAVAVQPFFYELPQGFHAGSMTTGPDGAMWFTGLHAREQGSTSVGVPWSRPCFRTDR